MRRVVTGVDQNGKEGFVADEQVQAATGLDVELFSLFHTSDPLTVPVSDGTPAALGLSGPGGLWVMRWTIPPHATSGTSDHDGALADLSVEIESGSAGWHATDSVDVVVVQSGAVELSVGTDRRVLAAGDAVVLGGQRHRWTNLGDDPVTLLSVMAGASRA